MPTTVRLPRVDDLLPPQAARRLLAALTPADHVTAGPSRRIGGIQAAGVHVVPGSPDSTVGALDVWVDPGSGLPLAVAVRDRSGLTALETSFLDVDLRRPADADVAPPLPENARIEIGNAPDLVSLVDDYPRQRFPWALAGLRRAVGVLHGSATYGTGLARFVVIPLPPGAADDVLDAMRLRTKVEEVPAGQLAVIDSGIVTAGVAGRRLRGAQLPAGRSRHPRPADRRGEGPAGRRRDGGATVTAGNGPVILTRGLTKRYRRVTAVDDVDLEVRAGDRYGFLGPNGSGKTTTVRMLLGLVYATSGSIEVLGRPVPRELRSVLPDVGALVEGPAAYPHLSAAANLALMDAAAPYPGGPGRLDRRARPAAQGPGGAGDGRPRRVGRRPVKAFSLGMRQRLGIAGALLRQPRLLVLDEPTNGLDPQGIIEMRDLFVRLNENGTTVFLSSHVLSEVEALCTRVGIMDRGRLVAQEELADLRRPTGRVLVQVGDPVTAKSVLDGYVESADGAALAVRALPAAEVNRRLVAAGVPVHEVVAQRRTLEDVVLGLTGPGSDRVDGAADETDAGSLFEPRDRGAAP